MSSCVCLLPTLWPLYVVLIRVTSSLPNSYCDALRPAHQDKFATMTVFRDGTGLDMNTDHHRSQNYGTLWCNLNLGKASCTCVELSWLLRIWHWCFDQLSEIVAHLPCEVGNCLRRKSCRLQKKKTAWWMAAASFSSQGKNARDRERMPHALLMMMTLHQMLWLEEHQGCKAFVLRRVLLNFSQDLPPQNSNTFGPSPQQFTCAFVPKELRLAMLWSLQH
jgi:hypothetical protein